MTGYEFSRLYAETYNTTYGDAKIICDTVFDLLGTVLYSKKEDITLYGVGSFKHKQTKQTQVRHPVTKEIVNIPPRNYIRFVETLREYE